LARLALYIIPNPFSVEKMRVNPSWRLDHLPLGMNKKIQRNFKH
jgi:hypothetical protein